MENAVSGLRCTGIVPLNKEILLLSVFLEDRCVVCPSYDETLTSPAEAAMQIPSHDQASFQEQARESCPAAKAETTPMPSSSNHVSCSLIMKLPCIPH